MRARLPVITGLLLGVCGLQAMAAPLTDFERFRSYPYMDRSYREAKNDNWPEVERLTRHLLERVPNNDEARALLVQALVHQRRFKDAEREAAATTDSKALLELRLAWIAESPPPASQVEQWIGKSDLNDRIRLWQAYSLSLARTGGAPKALAWLNQLQPKGDETVLRLARANWAEQVQDWDQTIAQLAPLADRGELDAENWRRLANAYVQRLDEAPLQRLLAKPPSAQAARDVRLAMADRAIALGHPQQAQRWLEGLPDADLQQPGQRQQLLELARQSGDSERVQRLSNELQRPCLETTDWLSRHDPQAARAQLRQCRAEDDPQRWLVLAQRLGATDLLKSQRLPEPWDTARQRQLLDVWRAEGNTRAELAWLDRQPRTAANLKRRAELLQRAGRKAEAADLWLSLYRLNGDQQALDQASFLQLQAGHRDTARQLLDSAYDQRQGRLSPPLLQRLADLYASKDAPLDEARINALATRVDPRTRQQLIGRLLFAREQAGDYAGAERYWQQLPHEDADSWAQGAQIARHQGNLPLAMERQRHALALNPGAEHYYVASGLAQQAGESEQSLAWLAEAVRRAPDHPRYRAEYGMRLAGSEDEAVRRTSIPYLQAATRDYPEDYRLGETLAWRYDEVEDSAAARKELRRVLDVEQGVTDGDDEYGSLEARKYRQRRAHEALSRRDSVTLASTWSPAGTSTNDNFRSDGRNGQERSAQSQNVQLAMWDHALGDEPSRNGKTLSVYGRVLFGGIGRSDYAQSMGTGVGLRLKPLSRANLNLYAELYHQRQIRDDKYEGLSLGELLNPSKVGGNWGDLRGNAESSNDLLLRATASFLDQGDYRNDWRVDEDQWNERFLYLDAAWWTRAGDHQWLSRYQQGHAWKLHTDSPQTLMPYGFVEFSSQDPDNDWRQDLRAGVGLRWQWWFDSDRYNAYRGSLKVRTEYQQSLSGNLYERANGMLLGVELNF